MKFSSLVILVASSVIGCNSSQEQDGKSQLNVQRTYFENGELKAEATYNRDSIKHGYSRLFYPDGALKLEVMYVNGRKEGLEKGYYKDGTLEYKGYNIDDHPIGEQLDYYANGTLQFYSFYDPVGRGVYRRSYDIEGNFLNEDGSKNTQIVSVTVTDNQFNIGDTLYIRVYTPSPPDTKAILKANILDQDLKMLESLDLKPEDGKAIFKKVLNQSGIYTFQTILTVTDILRNDTETYENSFQYEVHK